MTVNPTQNQNETSTVQKRNEEMKAEREKAVNEKSAQEKAARDAEFKPAVNNENQGKKIDVTA